jgi:ubiquinone/menaquinone biosynthesis C-methylase UbiE
MRRKDIQAEFSRQAERMDSAAAFHAEDMLSRLAKLVSPSPSDRVLDLACGPGIVAQALAPLAREIIGLDATPEMVRLARGRFARSGLHNGRFEVGAAEALPFGKASFDQVVTRLSLHHFPDLTAVLAEVRRTLRPSGHLTVADIICSDDEQESRLHNALEQLRDPTHIRMLSEPSLLDVLRESGFAILSEDTWQQDRNFSEWAQIVANPARTEPLRQVMRAVARAGIDAGIMLREDSGELYFVHTWLLVKAIREEISLALE